MKVVRRNAHRKIAAIALTIVKVRVYDQVRGGTVDLTEGTTAASAVSSALAYLDDPYYGSRLYDNEDGSYTLHVHSNLYFYLYTQAHVDAAQAEKTQRKAQERQQWTAIATPTRAQRNAASIARTTSIHDLGKPNENAATTRTKVETLDSELRRTDLDSSVQASLMSARAELTKPTITVTRTRMAIGEQISQACEALGIELGHGWSKGAATFLVKGRDYTAEELADLVLVGGFDANYGGTTVNVNWNSPLIVPVHEVDAAAKLLELAEELDANNVTPELLRMHLDRVRGIAHRLTVIEPRDKPDFPSGAAEPDFDVTAVRCVRTGEVWRRNGRGWQTGEGDASRWSTWYRMNEIDPMSEGFNIYREES